MKLFDAKEENMLFAIACDLRFTNTSLVTDLDMTHFKSACKVTRCFWGGLYSYNECVVPDEYDEIERLTDRELDYLAMSILMFNEVGRMSTRRKPSTFFTEFNPAFERFNVPSETAFFKTQYGQATNVLGNIRITLTERTIPSTSLVMALVKEHSNGTFDDKVANLLRTRGFKGLLREDGGHIANQLFLNEGLEVHDRNALSWKPYLKCLRPAASFYDPDSFIDFLRQGIFDVLPGINWLEPLPVSAQSKIALAVLDYFSPKTNRPFSIPDFEMASWTIESLDRQIALLEHIRKKKLEQKARELELIVSGANDSTSVSSEIS